VKDRSDTLPVGLRSLSAPSTALAGVLTLASASPGWALSGSHIVTASMFTDRSGAGGAITDDSYAELSNNPRAPLHRLDFAALGRGFGLPGPLPMYTRLKVTYRGRTLVGRKMDVGAGGRGMLGYPRAIDLSAGLARRLGFSNGLDLVRVTALGAPLPKAPTTDRLIALVRVAARRAHGVTYIARMRRIVGTRVMSLRYGLERRNPGQRGFHPIHVRGLGAWEYWERDRQWWYRQPVEGLHRGASYRAVVRFHWHDAKRKLLATAVRRSRAYTP
jgi:hypothetical protein